MLLTIYEDRIRKLKYEAFELKVNNLSSNFLFLGNYSELKLSHIRQIFSAENVAQVSIYRQPVYGPLLYSVFT